MMKADYISISEYANLKGVSVSAVYKRLNTSLKPYLKMVDNKKMLKYQLLIDENLVKDSTPLQLNSSTLLQPSSTFLEEQLKAKDEQIKTLQEELKALRINAEEKDKFIQKQTEELTELLKQSNKLNENNQILLGMAQDIKKLEESKQNKKWSFGNFFKG